MQNPAVHGDAKNASMNGMLLSNDGDAHVLRRLPKAAAHADTNDTPLFSKDSDAPDTDHSSDSNSSACTSSVGIVPTQQKMQVKKLSSALSFLVVGMYIFCGMMYYVCIRYSKTAGIHYSSAYLVLLTELVKMLVSVFLRYNESGEFLLKSVFFGADRKQVWKNGALFAIPSLLYAIYNNMTFFNLSSLNPGTYQLYMQMRIPITGFLTATILKTRISVRQWVGLIVLTVGVSSKFYSTGSLEISVTVFYVAIQALLSSLAGTYNELVLKRDAWKSVHVQNFFIYFFALLFNAVIGVIMGLSYGDVDLKVFTSPILICIVLLSAATGLSASLILKFINVIVKAFGSAADVLLTTIVAAILLDEPLTKRDVIAAVLVMTATAIYYTKGIGSTRYIHFFSN